MKIKILNEKKLNKKEKKKFKKLEKDVPKEKFTDKYGKEEGEDIFYGTITNMAKKNEEQLEEISSMAGGNVSGTSAPIGDTEEILRDNKAEAERSRLKEMFSTSTQTGGVRISIVPAEKEHAGHVERSQHQGLRNVMENDDSTQPMQGGSDNFAMSKQGTNWKLSDFADNPRNATRMFDVLAELNDTFDTKELQSAVLSDKTAPSRIQVMANKFGYDFDLMTRIENGDKEAVDKYYQFLINEFLFWIAYNPMSSAQQYSGRALRLSRPSKDLAYAHIYRYIKNPSVNNPKELSQRVSAQADFYHLEKDLDPALYDLPEE